MNEIISVTLWLTDPLAARAHARFSFACASLFSSRAESDPSAVSLESAHFRLDGAVQHESDGVIRIILTSMILHIHHAQIVPKSTIHTPIAVPVPKRRSPHANAV